MKDKEQILDIKLTYGNSQEQYSRFHQITEFDGLLNNTKWGIGGN